MSTTPPEPAAAAIVRREPRAVEAFDVENPVAMYMNTSLFEQVQRIAALMSKASLVPEHLRGADKLSDCFLIVGQAFRWGMDPFAVAQHTYVLKGKLGYEGKLIAAVVNTSGRLERPLSYTYSGAKGTASRSVTVTGTFRGEAEARTIEGTVSGWQTENQQWKTNPDQILAYRGAREWARRHMPEAVLGVQSDDEILEAAPAAEPREIPATTVDRIADATEKLRAIAPAPTDIEKPTPPVQNPDAVDVPECEPAKAAKKTEPKQAGLLGEEPAFLRAQARANRAAQGEK